MKPFLLVGLLLFVAGCLAEADHSNPLDPLSDDYVGGGVVGRVVTDGPDGSPVGGVVVRLERTGASGGEEARIVMTDAQGGFRFTRVEPGAYGLTASKAGYAERVRTLTVTDEAAEVQVALNGLPEIVDVSFVTVLQKQFIQQPTLSIEAAMQVTDPDTNPVFDSTWVSFPELGVGFPLQPTETDGVFAATVRVGQALGINDSKRLVGLRPLFHVRDAAGAEDSLRGAPIVHVFTEPLQIESPPDFSVQPPSLNTLSWVRVDSPFSLDYRVTLRDAQGVLLDTTVVDQRFLPLQTPLGPGEYTWFVVAIDIFGNRNVGRATFRISANAS